MSERRRFSTANVVKLCDVKHLTRFQSSRKFLLLENKRGILHALLSSKIKIIVNRIFNFILTKKYVPRKKITKCYVFP